MSPQQVTWASQHDGFAGEHETAPGRFAVHAQSVTCDPCGPEHWDTLVTEDIDELRRWAGY